MSMTNYEYLQAHIHEERALKQFGCDFSLDYCDICPFEEKCFSDDCYLPSYNFKWWVNDNDIIQRIRFFDEEHLAKWLCNLREDVDDYCRICPYESRCHAGYNGILDYLNEECE